MTLPSLGELPARRLAGALAVLALHVLILAAFVRATHIHTELVKPAREILLWFVPPKAKPELKKPPAVTAKPPSVAPEKAYPDYNHVTLPALPGHGTALKGLSSPFDCAPGSRGGLTPEQIAQCDAPGFGPRRDNAQVDYADHTNHSHDAALWARGRARKNSPTLLPCVDPNGFNPFGTLLCLGKAAVDGKFDVDNQPGYDDPAAH